jgi:hypothetical protein
MTTKDPMTITLGYDLPFRANAFTTPDDVLRIRVRCKPGTRRKALLQVEAHGVVFVDAALFGMGAGARVPPRLHPRSIDDVLRVSIGTTIREEVLLEAPVIVDPSYVTVLLHKLLGLSALVPIEEVTVELPGLTAAREPIPIRRSDRSELPEIYLPLPFAFEDENSSSGSRGCTLSILYEMPPNEPQLERLRDGLCPFIAQALQGGFISPAMGPDNYFIGADVDDVAVHDDQVTWVIEICDIAADGLNALVNFLAAYHQQVAPLREVILE